MKNQEAKLKVRRTRTGKKKEEERLSESPHVVRAIRLLVLTGCRLSEILSLKWEHVDFEYGCLRLPDSKTGAKTVPLAGAALELLATAPRYRDNLYVIPGDSVGQPLKNLWHAWRRIRVHAKLPDVRLHDLRHSFASVGAAAGLGLPIIGALLGHTQAETTQRYAHLAVDPLKEAADRIADRIAEAMKAKPKVVALRKG